MKNRLFFLFLLTFLAITFIITGAYYLLVLIFILITLIFISLLSMLLLSIIIKIELLENNKQFYFKYKSSRFLFGKMNIHFSLKNVFHQQIQTNDFELIICDHKYSTKIQFDQSNIGKYNVQENNIYIMDILGLFKKKIKKDLLFEMIQYPNINGVLIDHEKVNNEIVNYQMNKSDDYDIREYRIGDSLKDIHYKISYKLSNYMIKEKHKNQGNNVSVYLDLSGNNEDCEKVFSNLNQFIIKLQEYNETCIVKWISNQTIYDDKVSNTHDLNQCITKILSMPKCNETFHVQSDWTITPLGLIGGE